MSSTEIELNPVTHITADAIGQPGKRVFYIQAWQDQRTITIIIEKVQLQSLAIGVEQFLGEVSEKFPDLPEAKAEFVEEKMRIHPPVDPVFRAGEFGLGFDADRDMLVLVVRELLPEDQDANEAGVVRLWCTRAQLRTLAHWGMEVISRGRPLCPQCGEPMDPEGHFCPKKNGHKH